MGLKGILQKLPTFEIYKRIKNLEKLAKTNNPSGSADRLLQKMYDEITQRKQNGTLNDRRGSFDDESAARGLLGDIDPGSLFRE